MPRVPNMSDVRLYTPTEVGKMFGVSAATVKRWAKAGGLPYLRTPGHHLRFRAQDVEAALEAWQGEEATDGEA